MTRFPFGRIALYTLMAFGIPSMAQARELVCWEVEIDVPPYEAYQCTANGKDSKITPEQRQVLNTIIVVAVVAASATRIRAR